MHGVLASPRFRVSSNETRATTLVFTSPPYDKHERDREQLARVFVLSIVSRPTRIRERFLSLFHDGDLEEINLGLLEILL